MVSMASKLSPCCSVGAIPLIENFQYPLVTHYDEDRVGDYGNDYDDCNTPNINKENETTFMTPSSDDK